MVFPGDSILIQEFEEILGDAKSPDGCRRFHSLGFDYGHTDDVPLLGAERSEVSDQDRAEGGADSDADLEQRIERCGCIAASQITQDSIGFHDGVHGVGVPYLSQVILIGLVEKAAHALEFNAGEEQFSSHELHSLVIFKILHLGIDRTAVVEHQAVTLDLVQISAVFLQHPVESRIQAVQDNLILRRAQKSGKEGISGNIEESDRDIRFAGLAMDSSGLDDSFNQLPRQVEFLNLSPENEFLADMSIPGSSDFRVIHSVHQHPYNTKARPTRHAVSCPAVYIISDQRDNPKKGRTDTMILNENVDRKIIPIAGGKGGVGKSVIASNLALSMAMFGKKTVLVDLDLGGSNLHTILGVKNVNAGIGNFISGREYAINDLVCPTEWENLYFIPGDVLVYGIGELTKATKSRIVKGMMEIDADYVVIDLGGGTNFTVVDFFLISNSGLIITTPQNTSVMNAYSFLKNYVFRFLQRAFASDKAVSSYLKKILKERKPGERHTVTEILADIRAKNPDAGEKAEAFLEVLQPKLILNKINGVDDVAMAEGLRDLCAQNLSINLECLGTIMTDNLVDDSVNMQHPFILSYPDDVITAEIHRISQKVIQSSQFPEMPLELDYYSDSFELAQIEAENDLAVFRESDSRDTMNGGNDDQDRYDVEKLLELIRIQQGRINELQGTLRMLSFNQG